MLYCIAPPLHQKIFTEYLQFYFAQGEEYYYMKKQRIMFLVGCICLLAVGCTNIPLALPQYDLEAKQLTTDNEKALIYVYRTGTANGVVSPIKANDKFVGEIYNNVYIYFYSYPGQVKLTTYATPNRYDDRTIQVSSGAIYYVKLDAKDSGSDYFDLVSTTTGKKEVESMRLFDMKKESVLNRAEHAELLARKGAAAEEQERIAEKQEVSDQLSNCRMLKSAECYFSILEKYPNSANKSQVYSDLSDLIKKSNNPENDYSKLVQAYPDAASYIPITYRLTMLGPSGMTIRDIVTFSRQGLSNGLIISQIKSARGFYKKFDLAEISELKKLGLSDSIIQAIIEVTTESERIAEEKQRKAEMADLLVEIKHMKKKLDELKAAQTNQPVQQASNEGPSLQDTLKNCALQLGALEACRHAPGLTQSICKIAAKSQFPCDK